MEKLIISIILIIFCLYILISTIYAKISTYFFMREYNSLREKIIKDLENIRKKDGVEAYFKQMQHEVIKSILFSGIDKNKL